MPATPDAPPAAQATETAFPWAPHRYRSIATGLMKEDPSVEHADNGRDRTGPGYFAVTLVPTSGEYAVIAGTPSWVKDFFTRSWSTRDEARAVAEGLLAVSLRTATDLRRDAFGLLVEAVTADIESRKD